MISNIYRIRPIGLLKNKRIYIYICVNKYHMNWFVSLVRRTYHNSSPRKDTSPCVPVRSRACSRSTPYHTMPYHATMHFYTFPYGSVAVPVRSQAFRLVSVPARSHAFPFPCVPMLMLRHAVLVVVTLLLRWGCWLLLAAVGCCVLVGSLPFPFQP